MNTETPQPSLDGRVALITGASRGIGRAIAQRLAAAGATVVVTSRSLSSGVVDKDGKAVAPSGTLEETVALIEEAGGRAIAMACDVTNLEDREAVVDKVVERLGRIDILVNNAGISDYALVEKMSNAQFARTVDIYLTAPFAMSRAAIPHMRAQGQGWILNIGSAAAQKPLRPYRDFEMSSGMVVYGAAKAALARLTQGMAMEVFDGNIAVNLVAPSGAIITPGAAEFIPEGLDDEPIEYIAAVAFDLVHRPPSERTGIVAHSMHYAKHYNVPVTGLDGKGLLPSHEIPTWVHPDIISSGMD